MASQDKGSGPEAGQIVLYNYAVPATPPPAPLLAPAIIYGLGTSGTVNLNYFNSSGATNVTNVKFDYNLSAQTWAYPQFL